MELEPDQKRALLRAADSDREQTVAVLRHNHADGRLTMDEFTERMERAYAAKTFGDLDVLTADLPPSIPPTPSVLRPVPTRPPVQPSPRRNFQQHLIGYLSLNALMVAIWAVASVSTGRLLFFWPVWTLVGWGLAVGSHAVRAYGSPDNGERGGQDRYDRRYDHRSARRRSKRDRRHYYS